MGTGNILLGVTLRWTSIPSGGSSSTLSCFMLQKPRQAPAVCASLARVRLYLFTSSSFLNSHCSSNISLISCSALLLRFTSLPSLYCSQVPYPNASLFVVSPFPALIILSSLSVHCTSHHFSPSFTSSYLDDQIFPDDKHSSKADLTT